MEITSAKTSMIMTSVVTLCPDTFGSVPGSAENLGGGCVSGGSHMAGGGIDLVSALYPAGATDTMGPKVLK